MKPKVLIFIDWYTPGFKAGGPVRSMVNMISQLHDKVDFHVVTSDTEYTEAQSYDSVRSNEWCTGQYGEQIFYSSSNYRKPSNWRAILNSTKWDALYVNGMFSAWFSVMPLFLSRNLDLKRIVASRGMLAPGAMKHGSLKKKIFLSSMRVIGAYNNVTWQPTNENEAKQIAKHFGDVNMSIVPNLPKPIRNDIPKVPKKLKGNLNIVSVSRIAVEKNTLLSICALEPVHGRVQFDLYGPIYGSEYWEACQEAINDLPEGVSVLSNGAVEPAMVEEILSNAHLLLMPSAGENFGHTMLEALSTGTPILISDTTPWNELENARAGFNVQVADAELSMDELSKKIQFFVDMDQAEYDLWSSGAYAYARSYRVSNDAIDRTYALFQ